MTLRHCVVALDENGNAIQMMDLNPPRHKIKYKERKFWTEDWSKALGVSGGFNSLLHSGIVMHLHPRNRRNVPSVKVAGFEVVSENKE